MSDPKPGERWREKLSGRIAIIKQMDYAGTGPSYVYEDTKEWHYTDIAEFAVWGHWELVKPEASPTTEELYLKAVASLALAQTALIRVVADLRHAYANSVNGHIGDQKSFAEGLLAPQIRMIESLLADTFANKAAERLKLLEAEHYAVWAMREKNGNWPSGTVERAHTAVSEHIRKG